MALTQAEMEAKLIEIENKIAEIEVIKLQIEAQNEALKEINEKIADPINSDPIGYADWYKWAKNREPLMQIIDDIDFWAWKDAWEYKDVLLKGIENYLDGHVLKRVTYSLALHYSIIENFTYLDENGVEKPNPLYEKYKIANASGGITQSVSDVSSSASIVVTDAMKKVDILGQDLLTTPYGKFVYGILSTLNIYPVLL